MFNAVMDISMYNLFEGHCFVSIAQSSGPQGSLLNLKDICKIFEKNSLALNIMLTNLVKMNTNISYISKFVIRGSVKTLFTSQRGSAKSLIDAKVSLEQKGWETLSQTQLNLICIIFSVKNCLLLGTTGRFIIKCYI